MEKRVSVWAGKTGSQEKFEKYISEKFDDGENMRSLFMKDFGIDYYDSQFREAFFNDSTNKQNPLLNFSYIENFIDNLSAVDLSSYNSFVLLYNFNYTADKNKEGGLFI